MNYLYIPFLSQVINLTLTLALGSYPVTYLIQVLTLPRFTQKNILRVYPSAMRVKSSNFKPNIGWMYGAQMVACNMQVRETMTREILVTCLSCFYVVDQPNMHVEN